MNALFAQIGEWIAVAGLTFAALALGFALLFWLASPVLTVFSGLLHVAASFARGFMAPRA